MENNKLLKWYEDRIDELAKRRRELLLSIETGADIQYIQIVVERILQIEALLSECRLGYSIVKCYFESESEEF